MTNRVRVLVAALALSAGGFSTWMLSEGFSPTPFIPTRGDVPTIGLGSTHYEDGQPVRLIDPAITRVRAEQLARNLMRQDERLFQASLEGGRCFRRSTTSIWILSGSMA